MLRFHSLRVSEIRPDAEDAVAISLDASDEVRASIAAWQASTWCCEPQIDGTESAAHLLAVRSPGAVAVADRVRVHPNGADVATLANDLRVGDQLDVLPPNGSLTPRLLPTGGRMSAFASGCGITPVLRIARVAAAAQRRQSFILFYGNTSTARAMCLEELRR